MAEHYHVLGPRRGLGREEDSQCTVGMGGKHSNPTHSLTPDILRRQTALAAYVLTLASVRGGGSPTLTLTLDPSLSLSGGRPEGQFERHKTGHTLGEGGGRPGPAPPLPCGTLGLSGGAPARQRNGELEHRRGAQMRPT